MDRFIFDLDGTLISFPVAWDRVRADLKSLTGTSLEFNPFFLDFQVLTAEQPELRRPMLDVIDKYEALAVPGARLKEGAVDALSTLASRTKLSLVTMQGPGAAARILETLGIGRFFEGRYLTREDSLERAIQLEMAIERLGSPKGETVFVGDRRNDLRAAREVGLRFVMIRSQSDDPPADAIYRSVSEFARSRWVVPVKGSRP
jgi:phosphoglycolate phosphatase-like HAD superfamily hydrolase